MTELLAQHLGLVACWLAFLSPRWRDTDVKMLKDVKPSELVQERVGGNPYEIGLQSNSVLFKLWLERALNQPISCCWYLLVVFPTMPPTIYTYCIPGPLQLH